MIGSRDGADAVPELLDALTPALLPTAPLLGFQRTVGDEIQGVVDDASTLVEAVGRALRFQDWNIGVGFGTVEVFLPPTGTWRGAAAASLAGCLLALGLVAVLHGPLAGSGGVGKALLVNLFGVAVAGGGPVTAVVLALKGLGRYSELRADAGAPGSPPHADAGGVAERFIIGTFAGVLWAVGCAGVAASLTR